MSSGDVAKVHALERHPYAAIDRAAALIGKAVHRHRAQRSISLLTSSASQEDGRGGRT
jgi:hypothetical protein